MQKFEKLPIMPVDRVPSWFSLKICGDITHNIEFQADKLHNLSNSIVTGDFFCNDGWVTKGLKWKGVTVSDLFKEAKIEISEYSSVEFRGGAYSKVLTVEDVIQSSVLVAGELNGALLSSPHGGPFRLIGGNRSADFHVKWLTEICVYS
jgi:DMSO/TMAO reductase YedYZ molybdopterin-dependent catalytic subunit